MNKIISIGYTSNFSCYVNITKEEAINRFIKSEGMTREEFDNYNYRVDEIGFEDEFRVYDIWEK